VEVDRENGIMTYPGGGIALNNVIDLVRPRYVLQYLLRFRVKLHDIRMLERHDAVYKDRPAPTGDPLPDAPYQPEKDAVGIALTNVLGHAYGDRSYIRFNGSFGAVKLKIARAKRDELYSLIRQSVGMGIPIVEG
jgi:hypothetical protein